MKSEERLIIPVLFVGIEFNLIVDTPNRNSSKTGKRSLHIRFIKGHFRPIKFDHIRYMGLFNRFNKLTLNLHITLGVDFS